MSTSIPEGAVWQWEDRGIFYRRVDDRYEVWIPADPRWQDTLLLSDWLDSEDAKAKGITRIATPDDGWRYPPELPPEPMLCEVEWELTPIIGRPSISYWTGQIFRGCAPRAVAEQSPTLPHGGDMGDVLRWRPADRTESAAEPASVVLKSEADAAAERKHVRLSDEKGIDSFVAPPPAAAPKPIATPRLNLRQRWWWLP